MKYKNIFNQQTNNGICYTLTILSALLPLVSIYLNRFGYSLVLRFPSVILLVTMVLYVTFTVLACLNSEHSTSKSASIILVFAFPLSIINGLFVFFDIFNVLSFVFLLVTSICVLVVTFNLCRYFAISVLIGVISAIAYIFVLIFGFFALIFGGIRQDTVVEEVESPDGRYTAVVISSNQGALGGDTLVSIEYNSKNGVWLFSEAKKDPKTIYSGDWGEHETLDIQWLGENILSINGKIIIVDG